MSSHPPLNVVMDEKPVMKRRTRFDTDFLANDHLSSTVADR